MCGGHHTHREHTTHEPQTQTAVNVTPMATHPCPTCGKPVQDDFVVCPYCGTQLKRSCPSCGRAVDVNWNVCAYCGADLTASAGQ